MRFWFRRPMAFYMIFWASVWFFPFVPFANIVFPSWTRFSPSLCLSVSLPRFPLSRPTNSESRITHVAWVFVYVFDFSAICYVLCSPLPLLLSSLLFLSSLLPPYIGIHSLETDFLALFPAPRIPSIRSLYIPRNLFVPPPPLSSLFLFMSLHKSLGPSVIQKQSNDQPFRLPLVCTYSVRPSIRLSVRPSTISPPIPSITSTLHDIRRYSIFDTIV